MAIIFVFCLLDEWGTPLSTPPSEEAEQSEGMEIDSDTRPTKPPPLDLTCMSEETLMDRLYERYSTDLYIL